MLHSNWKRFRNQNVTEPIGVRWCYLHVFAQAKGIDFAVAAKPRASALAAVNHEIAAPEPLLDFDEFYQRHRDEIGRALVFTLGDQSLGQEAVDEAMATAYQRWDQLRGTENPAGWVYVVGRRWGLSWRRGRRREQRREQSVSDQDRPVETRPEDVVDLMASLHCLNVDQRTVVVCRFSLGLSVKETAALLGVGEGTVKSRLGRAIERLRANMEVPE